MLVRAALARECAALGAGKLEPKAEWFAVEQPGQTVLVQLAFSQRRAKRALAQQARAAPRERLVWEVARREKALAASPTAASAQVASPRQETTSARAILRKSETPRVLLERAFLLLEEPREQQAAGQVHLRSAQPRGQRK